MFAHPRLENVAIATDRFPVRVEAIRPFGVILGIAGERTRGHDGDGVDGPTRQHDAVYVGAERVNHLFDEHDRSTRSQDRLLLHAGYAPEQHVAVTVRLLGADDPDVEVECGHRGELLTCEGARDPGDVLGHRREVRTGVAPQDPKGQTARARRVARRHAGVTVLFDLKRVG